LRTTLPDVFGDIEQQWEASPLKHVTGREPPYLVLYADDDNPGQAADNTAFYNALIAAGAAAELHEIQNRNHAAIISAAARVGDPAREFILRFLADHLQ
jgi:dipeptidyl aminopeptidase/acylaminoacyl peptidase